MDREAERPLARDEGPHGLGGHGRHCRYLGNRPSRWRAEAQAIARGPLVAALELYRLSPGRRPDPADARIMWDIGQAVDAYVTRLFEAGVLCPFSGRTKDEASDRSG
jgi:hypothetical protein